MAARKKNTEIDGEDIISEEESWDLWFQGTEREVSDAILNFLRAYPNKGGVTFAQLENFFVLKKNICSRRSLCNQLNSLKNHGLVRFEVSRGLKFYMVR